MCDIHVYEIVSLNTTREDVLFIFHIHNGYIRSVTQIVDAVYTHDGCYVGIII